MATQNKAGTGTGQALAAPGSFAFQMPQGIPSAAGAISGSGARAGLEGLRAAVAPQVDGSTIPGAIQGSVRDAQALLKLGGALVQKKVEQAQDAAYWEGVKKAATGEALQSIIANQPWYSQIFGDSGLVEGARAYTQQKNLNDALANVATQMPELRKQPVDQVMGTLIGVLDGMMTGDPMTDAVLKQQASQHLPSLIKAHASERYAYLQEATRSSQFEAWDSEALLLQQAGEARASGMLDNPTFEAAQQRFLMNMAPLDGQNDASYKQNVLSQYRKAAQDGNFHAINVMDKAGFRQFLTPEQQKTIDDDNFRYGQRQKAKWVSTNMAEDIAGLRAAVQTGQVTPSEAAVTARSWNQRFRDATGIDEDVINVEQITTTAAVELFQDAKRGLTKIQEKEQATAEATMAFASGYGRASYNDIRLSTSEADRAFRELYTATDDKVGLLVNNAARAPLPYVSASLQGEVRAVIQSSVGSQWNTGLQAALEGWRAINSYPNGGRETASAYYGVYHSQFQQMDTLLSRGMAEDVAYQQVFGRPLVTSPELTKENQKKLDSAVASINEYGDLRDWVPFVSGPLSEPSLRAVKDIVGHAWDQHYQLNPYDDVEASFKMIAKSLQASGELEVYGQYAWSKDAQETPLVQYVGSVGEWVGEALDEVIKDKLKAQGLTSIEDYTMRRMPDIDGEPSFILQIIGDDYNSYSVPLRGSEIKAVYDTRIKPKRTSNRNERAEEIRQGYVQPGVDYDWTGLNQ